MKNKAYKIGILVDNYNQYLETSLDESGKENQYSFKDYIKYDSENDPSFFSFLFDKEENELNEQEQKEWEELFANLPDFVPSEEEDDLFYYSASQYWL